MQSGLDDCRSVRLSVRLSLKHMLCDKTSELFTNISIPLHLVLGISRTVGAGPYLTLKVSDLKTHDVIDHAIDCAIYCIVSHRGAAPRCRAVCRC